jgi:hypothetical protein
MGAMISPPIYNRDILERQKRLCQCCNSGACDERLLDYSALQSVRDWYAHLFVSQHTMKMMIWHRRPAWHFLIDFAHA